MIDVSKLAKSYGARVLFEDVSLKLIAGARYGLVGANGSGKTTFLEILAGDEPATDGTRQRSPRGRASACCGRTASSTTRTSSSTWRWWATSSSGARSKSRSGSSPRGSPDPARLAELEDRIARPRRLHPRGARERDPRRARHPGRLPPAAARRRSRAGSSCASCSRRCSSAAPTCSSSTSRPTTSTSSRSAGSRSSSPATRAARSSSRTTSASSTTSPPTSSTSTTATITLYTGNYTAFAAEKAAVRERKEAEIARAEAIDRREARLRRALRRQGDQGEAGAEPAQADREDRGRGARGHLAPRRRSSTSPRRGRAGATCSRSTASPRRTARSRCCATCRSPCGAASGWRSSGRTGSASRRSLKIATGNLDADAGRVRWGHEVRVGYFAQDHHEVLTDPDDDAARLRLEPRPDGGDELRARAARARALLGRRRRQARRRRSPAARRRASSSAGIMVEQPERPRPRRADQPPRPRGHPRARRGAPGVRGDGALRLARSLVRLRARDAHPRGDARTGSATSPAPTTSTWRSCGDDHLDADAVVLRAKKQATAPPAKGRGERALSWEEQKRRRNRQKQLPARRDKVLAAIEAAEARKAEIHALWCAPGYAERTLKSQMMTLEDEEKSLGPKIEALVAEWEAIEKEIEDLSR